MNENDELIPEFYEDTQSHLENIEADVLKLEDDHDQSDIIDAVFRMVHSIKGNAGMLGLDQIRLSGEVFETFLDDVRERKTATSAEVDAMFKHLDTLKGVVNRSREGIQGEEIAASDLPAPPEPDTKREKEAPLVEKAGATALAVESEPAKENARAANKPPMVKEKKANPIKEPDPSITFLTFKLEDEHYGIDITKVREIILKEEITPVPNTVSYVLGVMNLRDQIIPVFNLKEKLMIEEYDKTAEEKNVIVIEIHKSTTGLRVDEVTGIVTLHRDKISPGDDFLGAIPTDYLHGMGQTEEDTLILLNIDDLCDPEEKLF